MGSFCGGILSSKQRWAKKLNRIWIDQNNPLPKKMEIIGSGASKFCRHLQEKSPATRRQQLDLFLYRIEEEKVRAIVLGQVAAHQDGVNGLGILLNAEEIKLVKTHGPPPAMCTTLVGAGDSHPLLTPAVVRMADIAADEETPEVPEKYLCSLTMEILVDPVFLSSGETCSRAAAVAWLAVNSTCPWTREPVTKVLVPDKGCLRAVNNSRHPEVMAAVAAHAAAKADRARRGLVGPVESPAAATAAAATAPSWPTTLGAEVGSWGTEALTIATATVGALSTGAASAWASACSSWGSSYSPPTPPTAGSNGRSPSQPVS